MGLYRKTPPRLAGNSATVVIALIPLLVVNTGVQGPTESCVLLRLL